MGPKKAPSTELAGEMKDLIRSEVNDGLSSFMNSALFLESIADALVERIGKKLEESANFNADLIAGLRRDLEIKSKEVQELRQKLEERTDQLEMYTRRNSLRIFGIEECDKENTDDLVLQVAEKISVPLGLCDIDRSHRVGPKVPGKKRPIIVKFVSYRKRREMFQVKRRLKGQGITIREDLTRARLEVLHEAIRRFDTRNVWTEDGTVMIRQGTSRRRVHTMADLQAITK